MNLTEAYGNLHAKKKKEELQVLKIDSVEFLSWVVVIEFPEDSKKELLWERKRMWRGIGKGNISGCDVTCESRRWV